MTPGLPALPPNTTTEDRRAWELWTRAVVDRIRREATVGCADAAEGRGMERGAQRVAELLLSGLTPPPVAE